MPRPVCSRRRPACCCRDIIAHAAPYGFFPAVVPGTQFVTLGGAIANDVHGKNHHRRGTFGCHVERFTLLRSDGRTYRCSATDNPRLFAATIGGMGLTGLILSASIRLMRVPSLDIVEKMTPFRDLGEYLRPGRGGGRRPTNMPSPGSTSSPAAATAGAACCSPATMPSMARMRPRAPAARLSVPFQPPFNVLNRPFLTAFNAAYRWKKGRATGAAPGPATRAFSSRSTACATGTGSMARRGSSSTRAWCRKRLRAARCRRCSTAAREAGQGSFLTVLKRFGAIRSPALLSFPRPGYTLTLDFPNRGAATLALLERARRASPSRPAARSIPTRMRA